MLDYLFFMLIFSPLFLLKQDKKKGNSLLFIMNVLFVIKGMLLSSSKQ